MKRRWLFAMMLPALLFAGCSKKDDVSTSTVSSTVTSGTWRVTYYAQNGTDKTTTFSGYSFTFISSGALTASKNGANVAGTWATGTDNSQVKLVLNFLSPPTFISISQDWHVLERTDAKIRTEHVSGGNGGTDNITFEKN